MMTYYSYHITKKSDYFEIETSISRNWNLETFIISEIVKSYNAKGEDPNIYYYRDKEKNEIDLLFLRNNKLIPFEIKKQPCQLHR